MTIKTWLEKASGESLEWLALPKRPIVYLAYACYHFEGSEVIGVFAKQEDAVLCCSNHKFRGLDLAIGDSYHIEPTIVQ